MIKELLKQNRSFRRFDESERISSLQLKRWVEVVRYTASMRNVQPIKYLLITNEEKCRKLREQLGWAGYFPEWDGPKEGERPTAYVVQMLDTDIAASARFDEGIQLQAITLAVAEDGYGCCILRNFSSAELVRFFELPENLHPIAVIAVGKPTEKVVIEDLHVGSEDVKYWRDESGVHHVPKRTMEELITKEIE